MPHLNCRNGFTFLFSTRFRDLPIGDTWVFLRDTSGTQRVERRTWSIRAVLVFHLWKMVKFGIRGLPFGRFPLYLSASLPDNALFFKHLREVGSRD